MVSTMTNIENKNGTKKRIVVMAIHISNENTIAKWNKLLTQLEQIQKIYKDPIIIYLDINLDIKLNNADKFIRGATKLGWEIIINNE